MSDLHTLKTRIGGYIRQGFGEDTPEVIQARRALQLAKTETAIRTAIEAAPPLDADTLERIRALIPATPTTVDGKAAA